MKPQGLTPIKFPSKTDCHPPKGYINWWEDISTPSNKRARQAAKKYCKSYK